MPLDCTDYGTGPQYFGSGSQHSAMLIAPNAILESDQPMMAECLAVAMWLFTRRMGIEIEQLFVTSSVEVTTGHLDNHRDRICLLAGRYNAKDGTHRPECLIGVSRLFKGRAEETKMNLPSIVRRLLDNEADKARRFYVVTNGEKAEFELREADVAASRSKGVLALKRAYWTHISHVF